MSADASYSLVFVTPGAGSHAQTAIPNWVSEVHLHTINPHRERRPWLWSDACLCVCISGRPCLVLSALIETENESSCGTAALINILKKKKEKISAWGPGTQIQKKPQSFISLFSHFLKMRDTKKVACINWKVRAYVSVTLSEQIRGRPF